MTRQHPTDHPVTIDQVAAVAQVSKASVSRVLNGRPVREATRRRVTDAIRSLDYHPNSQARSLSLRKTRLIGVITPMIADPFFSVIIAGIEEVLEEHNYLTALSRTLHRRERELSVVQMMRERRVDGVLLLTPREAETNQTYEAAQRSGHHAVVIDADPLDSSLSAVNVDNHRGGKLATEHLIALGHRRIAVVCGVTEAKEARDRLAGYRLALEAHGVAFDPALVFPGDYRSDSGRRAAESIVASETRPTAIFFMNDQMAIAGMNRLQELGFRVPEDIAIVGYDDINDASLVRPQLTTVRQPLRQMGRVAAQRLLALIDGKTPDPVKIMLPVELVVRQSCGGGMPRRTSLPDGG